MNKNPLRAWRERQVPPLNSRQLANLLDVSTATMSRWETGKRLPDGDQLLLILEKTGITAAEMRPDLVRLLRLRMAPEEA